MERNDSIISELELNKYTRKQSFLKSINHVTKKMNQLFEITRLIDFLVN